MYVQRGTVPIYNAILSTYLDVHPIWNGIVYIYTTYLTTGCTYYLPIGDWLACCGLLVGGPSNLWF